MECAKSFQITVDPATACPALLDTWVTPLVTQGVASASDGPVFFGLVYVVPLGGAAPGTIWKYDTSGFFLANVSLLPGVEQCQWIEWIPSTASFHLVVLDSGTFNPVVQIMNAGGGMGAQIIPPDNGWGPISYDAGITRSFMYGGANNLLEFNGNAVDRTIAIGIDTARVAYANAKIYCPDSSANDKVRVINYATMAVVTDIAVVIGDWVVSVGNKVFGFANNSPSRIIVMSATTDTVTNTIAVDAGFPYYQLSYLPATGLLYAFTDQGGYAIDPVTETVVCQFSAVNQASSEYALYSGGGGDTQKAIFVPEFNTTNLRKYG